ncbi:4Fe-4S dicluster domain-containing protein [candidate division KSB1 bacterium]|nr:4Fe-4S dicluster domain-containing protein [candidate division KSB1 bacterium]
MPWVNVEACDGCGICVADCPVDTILLEKEQAEIIMEGCIRCGVCHDVCPQDAIKHDSEKVSEIIAMNVEQTLKNMELCAYHLRDEGEKAKCLNRMINHFKRQKMIAEKTLEELAKLNGA